MGRVTPMLLLINSPSYHICKRRPLKYPLARAGVDHGTPGRPRDTEGHPETPQDTTARTQNNTQVKLEDTTRPHRTSVDTREQQGC